MIGIIRYLIAFRHRLIVLWYISLSSLLFVHVFFFYQIRRGRNSVYDKLTVTLLKDIIAEYLESGRVGNCLLPMSIRNVLNSLACHGTYNLYILIGY